MLDQNQIETKPKDLENISVWGMVLQIFVNLRCPRKHLNVTKTICFQIEAILALVLLTVIDILDNDKSVNNESNSNGQEIVSNSMHDNASFVEGLPANVMQLNVPEIVVSTEMPLYQEKQSGTESPSNSEKPESEIVSKCTAQSVRKRQAKRASSNGEKCTGQPKEFSSFLACQAEVFSSYRRIFGEDLEKSCVRKNVSGCVEKLLHEEASNCEEEMSDLFCTRHEGDMTCCLTNMKML